MTSDKIFDMLTETALKKAGEAAELAYALYRTLEGDDVAANEILLKYGYVDDDYEWAYRDDE